MKLKSLDNGPRLIHLALSRHDSLVAARSHHVTAAIGGDAVVE
jgi:hypothetical protein